MNQLPLTYLIIIVIAFLKSIADTIKVPSMFDNSYFSRFKGVSWIDPLVTKPEKGWFIFKVFNKMFRDLWHTCNTLQYTLFMLLAIRYQYEDTYLSFTLTFVLWWLILGYTFEWCLGLWKFYKK